MDERSLETVLLTSENKKIDLCFICKNADVVETVKTDLITRLREMLQGIKDFVDRNALYIDELFLSGRNQAKHCLECILSLLKNSDIQSVTIMSDGEPFEFYAEDFIAA